jgi:hypothetical protein
MTHTVITQLEQVSTAWLTAVLTRSGGLTSGQVASFTLDAGQGNWSTSASLRLTYTSDARGERPARLFLKMVETDLGDGETFSDSEVRYYTHDYRDLAAAPLLCCCAAAFDAHLARYHLLLQDVSETHVAATEKAPTLEYGLALAEGLAVLHAHWWGEARLAEAGASRHDAQHIQRFIDIARPGLEPILARFSAALQPAWPAALQEIFTCHPQALLRRNLAPQGFTLIHGDVGSGNVLTPRQGERPIYIIDRQPFNWSLTTWLGVYDLAYAVVLDWEIEARRRWEYQLLQRYHARLVECGVAGYSWEQCCADYRLCLPMGVYIATEYCRGGINEAWVHAWLPMLQRALTACDDWQANTTWR